MSLSDFHLHCESHFERIYPRAWILCLYSAKNILKDLSQLWLLSTKNSIIFISLSSEKILQREAFFGEKGLKVESKILRLMLKTFPISQVWDGGYYLFVVYMLRLKNIDNALDIGRYLFVKTASSVRCVVNPAIFLLARIGVRSRIWGKTLNVLDASR